MLRFIWFWKLQVGMISLFQYIPCYGLSGTSFAMVADSDISIHPMLRFIKYRYLFLLPTYWFQYIPCYGLSITMKWKNGRLLNFNTSHVTVYLRRIIGIEVRKRISIHPMLRFIYIFIFTDFFRQHFNTSHVTVYLTDM